MKITPLGGQGQVTPQATPDRKEAAKQAFIGQSGKTITPSENNPVSHDVRKIQMKTTNKLVEDQEVPLESATPDTDAPIESEGTRPISPQFAELARQRRALQVRERELADKEKSLKASGSQGIEIEKIKSNPLGVLLEAGVTYEQLTEAVLNAQASHNPEVDQLKAKIAALEKGVEDKFTERDTQAVQQALAKMRTEADALVAEGDDFELVRGHGYQGKVVDLIHKHWKATGEVLDVKKAATLIEEELVADALKATGFKKVQSQLNTVQEETPKLRTLTNSQTAQNPQSAKARAIAAFNGTLKKG